MAAGLASSSIQEQNPVGTAHFVFGLVVIIMQLVNVRVAWQCMVICVAMHGRGRFLQCTV